MRTKRNDWWNRATRTAALLFALGAAACSSDGDGPFEPGRPQGPKPVASVVVSPDTVVLQAGQTRMLSAVPRAADRTELPHRAVEWSSSDSTIVRVTRDGILVANAPGSVTITATSEGKQGYARVQVSPPPGPPAVAYVHVTPGEVTMSEDPATWKLTAKTWAADGTQLFGRAVTWSSSDTTIVKVYDGNLVISGSGTAYVTASSEGKSAKAKVTVPEWQREQVLKNAAGSALPAQIGTSTYVDDSGVTRTVRVVVTGGSLRFSTVGSRYEQRLTLQTYEDGVLVGASPYFDRGTILYDLFTGTPIFTSTLYANHEFRSIVTSDGGLAVTQRVLGEGSPATFIFGKK